MAITQPGAKPVKRDEREKEDDGEESDEYEVADEEGDNGAEDDEDEDSDEDEGEEGGGLTALLLSGKTQNANEDEEDAEDTVWVPDGGKEPAEYSGEEDEEEHERTEPVPKTPEKPPAKNVVSPPNKAGESGNKKRAREDEPTEEARDGKKTKLPVGLGP